MAEQVAPPNGPGLESGQGPPSWEKPMATHEMRQKCDKWTLAGDAGLLNFLQQFSQKVISRTHEMEQLLNSLDHEAKVTCTKVSNVMNDFHMLSNTQFVESRVYDEDVVDEGLKGNKKPEETKTKEQREAELVAKISSALNLGLTTLEHAFDKVELQEDSDSEEDDSIMKGGTILEARDPYLHRPLPLLIGTSGFFSDDYVGLQDVLSEEEASPEKEDFGSELSSESESEPELIAVTKPRVKDLSDSESRGSDLFPSGGEEGEYLSRSSSFSTGSEAEKVVNVDQTDKSQVAPPVGDLGPGLLADELDNRLRKYNTDKTVKNRESRVKSDTASIHSRSSRKSTSSNRHTKKAMPVKKAPSEEDLFGHTEDVNEEEEEALFGRKGGLFSTGGKLFDSEEGGLFDDSKQETQEPEEKLITPKNQGKTQSGKKIPAGARPVLTDGDLFSSPKSRKSVDERVEPDEVPHKDIKVKDKSSPKPVKPERGGGGLFDDSEDDDDLFGFSNRRPPTTTQPSTKSSAPPKKVATKSTKTRNVDLFASDEDSSDLFGVPEPAPDVKKEKTKKRPAGAKPMFGDLSNAISSAMKASKDGDSDNSSDSGPGSSGGNSSRSRSSLPGTAGSQSGTAVPTPKQTPSQSMKPSRSNSVSSNSLFAEDPEMDDLFTTVTTSRRDSKVSVKEQKKPFLFEDNSDEDGNALFSSQPSAPSRPQSVTATASSHIVSDLFEDIEDDNSLFAAVTKPRTSSHKAPSGLSLFEDKPSVTQPPVEQVKQEVKPKTSGLPEKKVSLFDEDDAEDDALFSSGPSSKSMQSPGSLSRDSSVPSPVTSVPTIKESGSDEVDALNTKKAEEEVTKTRATSLFDDEDLLFGGPPSESPEVDLFTPKQAEPVEKPAPKVKSPVGGVALFGGINPFANRIKPPVTEVTEAHESEKATSPTVPVVEEPKRRRPPALKETKEISVSFDDPVDTRNTLLSAAKDRAKVQAKRRPPSRKGRQAASRNSGVDFLNETPEPAPSQEVKIPSVQEQPVQQTEPILNSTKSGATSKSDSFLSVAKDVDLQSPSTEEEDLFSVGEPKKDSRLFMAASKSSSQDLSKGKKNKVPDIFGSDDDDDIFSSLPTKRKAAEDTSTSNIQKNGDASVKVNDLFGDVGDDDIFSSSAKQEKKTAKKNNTRSIFDDDGDDDDIFATRANSKPSQSSQVKEATRKTLKNSSSVETFSDPLLSLQNEDSLK